MRQKIYLKNQYGRVYSSLNGKIQQHILTYQLASLKSINVNFVGQINFPGVYPVHPFSNLFDWINSGWWN